jgi:hypothetical protein
LEQVVDKIERLRQDVGISHFVILMPKVCRSSPPSPTTDARTVDE